MQPPRFSYLVLQPSFFSFTMSLFIGVLTLGAANWSYVLHDLLFYDYFFGTDGLVTGMQYSSGKGTFMSFVFSESFLNNALIVLGAAVLGTVLYLILEGIRHLRDIQPPIPRREARQRALIRLLIAGLWALYLQLTFKVVLPFCVLATQVGIKALWDWKGMLYIIFGLAIFAACWHAHVIFMRLFLLRVRVFGNVIS